MLKRRSLLRPLGLAILLGVGAGIVWAVLLGIAQRSLEQLGPKVAMNENLMVGSDGTVLIFSYLYYPYRKETFRTLDGREVENAWRLPLLQGAELLGLDNPYVPFAPYKPFMMAQRRVTPVGGFGRPPAFWYFVHDGKPNGRGYFVGFHADSKRLAGYLGAKGFRDDVPSADEQLPVDLRQVQNGAAFPVYKAWGSEPRDTPLARDDESMDPNAAKLPMISDDRLLEIDFRTGGVRELLKLPGLMSVGFLSRPMPPAPKPGATAKPETGEVVKPLPRLLAVRTPDQVRVWDRVTGKWRSYAVPPEIRDLSFVEFSLFFDDAALFIATRQFPDRSPREEIVWVDAKGGVTRQAEVELAGRRAAFASIADVGRGSGRAGPDLHGGVRGSPEPAGPGEGQVCGKLPECAGRFAPRGVAALGGGFRPWGRAGVADLPAAAGVCPAVDWRLGGIRLPGRSAGVHRLSLASPLAAPASLSGLRRLGAARSGCVLALRRRILGAGSQGYRSLRAMRARPPVAAS